MYKAHQVRTTLEIEMSKKWTQLWREAHFEVKSVKNWRVQSTFGSWDVEKVHAVVAQSTIRSQKCKKWGVRSTFGRSDIVLRGRRKGLRTLSKVSKMRRFCSMSKNDGRRGTFEEDLQRCIFRGRGSTRDMFIRAVRRSGPWFPERGCILERQIFRFAEMILRDRCNNLYDLASRFPGRCSTLDRWSGKIAKSIGTRPSALHSTFHFWRKSRRIVSFLMLSTSKIFRFWCCQVQKLRKSRRIVSFFVSQNCFVLDVAKFKNWGSLAEAYR